MSPPALWGRSFWSRVRIPYSNTGSPPRTWGALHALAFRHDSLRFTPTHVGSTARRRAGARRPAVHPHARGEHGRESGPRSTRAVHPHARGEHAGGADVKIRHRRFTPTHVGSTHPNQADRRRSRFTPTHVGSTPAPRMPRQSRPVHPHARGEHAVGAGPGAQHARFTPTYVGSTSRRSRTCWSITVHPHARGEHLMRSLSIGFGGGSPPRTWGALHPDHGQRGRRRFTPTHVGSTSPTAAPARGGSVHPHARGEHVGDRRGRAAGVRFTPTHVGSTRFRMFGQGGSAVHPHARGEHCPARSSGRRASVHPHARGEHVADNRLHACPNGSPPRTWGARYRPAVHRPRAAVHPHARGEHRHRGKSIGCGRGSPPRTWGARHRRHRRPSERTVHPHARGEHGHGWPLMAVSCGSPPRTWGAPATATVSRQKRRFTPTHVGSTIPPRLHTLP